ncbi:MAG: DNA recombination protein RmuC [bacterium]
MEIQTIAITFVIVGVALYILKNWFRNLEEKTKTSDELIEWLKDLGQRVESSTAAVDQKLTKNMQMFNTRLDKAAEVISRVQKNIGEFTEIGRSMKDLQDFLSSPKLRGNIGEQILNDLLKQNFPSDSYSLQFTFKNGYKVDAIIKTANGIIPIDSKFPMENFRKMINETSDIEKKKIKKVFTSDVKKHIVDISKKYILPEENTVDYALMYIPSEAIYYEIINDSDLFDFYGENRVLPVSPMSFFAYMKAILMSFEGEKIQSKAKEILEILRSIKKDYEKIDTSWSVLTKHLTNAYNQTSQVSKNLLSLSQKITSTKMLTSKDKNDKLL